MAEEGGAEKQDGEVAFLQPGGRGQIDQMEAGVRPSSARSQARLHHRGSVSLHPTNMYLEAVWIRS